MSLKELRAEIDRVDSEIIRLLNERLRLAGEVGKVKKTSGKAIFDPDREELLLQRLEKMLDQERLPAKALRAIYHEIFSVSRANQRSLRIAYLGPEGTNSHQVALERFGQSDELLPMRTIPDIFSTVSSKQADIGIVPIENSIEGGVNVTHDELIQTDLMICGEYFLQVRHSLITTKDLKDTGSLKKIYSHPQALAQCRKWLADNLPQAELIPVTSTSEGVRIASKEKGAAAVAGNFAAKIYGMRVFQENIHDHAFNSTRFLFVGEKAGNGGVDDRTSLILSIPHKPGALSEVLNIFAQRKISLLKIESRPAIRKQWEYIFFMDIKGNVQQTAVAKALEEVVNKTLWLKKLGSYPQASRDV